MFVSSEHCKCVSGGVEQGVYGRKRVMSRTPPLFGLQ